jgi:hypothetical protein
MYMRINIMTGLYTILIESFTNGHIMICCVPNTKRDGQVWPPRGVIDSIGLPFGLYTTIPQL